MRLGLFLLGLSLVILGQKLIILKRVVTYAYDPYPIFHRYDQPCITGIFFFHVKKSNF